MNVGKSKDTNKGWEVKPSTGAHFDVLDGIRGIAILMVVFFHGFYVNPKSTSIFQVLGGRVIQNLNEGVPIFFVLSGFLISYPFFRKKHADARAWYVPGYWRRRIGKILPPFYLSLSIFTAILYFHYRNPEYLKAAGLWVTGLANFIQTSVPINDCYWSLIVEAQFYVFLPILFFLNRGLNLSKTCLTISIILLAVPLIVRQVTWPVSGGREELLLLTERFPCQLDFFAWGVFFAGIFTMLGNADSSRRPLACVGYTGIVFLIFTFCMLVVWTGLFNSVETPTRWSTESTHFLMGTSSFLLLFFVFDPQCLAARILSASYLRFIGIVSYEWFLFHQPVLFWFRGEFGSANGSIFKYLEVTVLPMALTFGLSVLVYRFFSFPLLNYIRGNKKNRPAPVARTLTGAL
ncbi:MAG TPA: acyltransferase [Verrucomicrobiae bacterium]|jgi:peptidoglycan/LPS O-acetylase OafA/YrhL|nr:acyltransferase [Verrucomicrobiae bacterium]